MNQRTNAGYNITDSIHVGDTEFVLGTHKEVPDLFVTWRCRNGKSYFWGHYFSSLLEAQKDLAERALEYAEREERRLGISRKPKREELER